MNGKTFMMWNKSKFIICVSCRIYKWFYYMIVLQNVLSPHKNLDKHTAWKASVLGFFLVWIFPRFGLNRKRYSVSLRIQSKCGKILIRKALNTDTFHIVTSSRITCVLGYVWIMVLIPLLLLQPRITKISRIPFTHRFSYISGNVSNIQP